MVSRTAPSRIAALLLAVAVLVGLAVAPAAVADTSVWTGTIRVQLASPNGANFAKSGFVVTASGMTQNVYKEATTNAAGVAALKVPQGKYTITVATYRSDYRYAVVHQSYIAITRGQVKTIGMTMYLGATVTGKVTAGGKPLKNATVVAARRNGVIMASTTTDKKGHYALKGLSTGVYVIMFNQRSWADPDKKIVSKYGWSFWKGSSLSDAQFVGVFMQNKYVGPTKTPSINGSVKAGTQLRVSLTSTNNAKGRLLVDRVTKKGLYIPATSVYAPFLSGTAAKLQVEAGRYRLGVTYGSTTYYYTGDRKKLTKRLSKATFVTFTSKPLTVVFGPR